MYTFNSSFAVVLVLAAVLSADSKTLNQAPAPPTGAAATANTVGKVVGTGLSAVLTAAFPAAATIINAIWGDKTTQKKTGSEAQQPLNALTKASASQVQQLSADLDTVDLFLADCVVADRNVVQMQDYLGKKTILTKADGDALGQFWNKAEPRLTELGKDAAKTSAKAVSDEYTRRSLLAITETNYGDLKNIDDDIKNLNATGLSDLLAVLEPKLSAVAALSADIIGQVSAGLRGAAKNLAPGQGPEEAADAAFAKRIGDNRTEYQQIMKDVYGVAPKP